MARRLYLAFLGVLVVVFALTATINFFTGRGPLSHPGPPLAGHLARTLDTADDLQRAADDAYQSFNVDITVLDPRGQVAAQAGAPIDLPPQIIHHLRGPPQWIHAPRLAGASLRMHPGFYLVVRMDAQRLLLHPLLLLGAILGVTLLLVIPLSRSITRPLERLTKAVRAYGKGDLSQRSGLGDLRDEVGELARSFDEMADRIQAARRAEKELLANVSHELRTPLARMKVAMELIEVPNDSVRKRLASLSEEVDELDRLVSDILTAARLEVSSLPLRKQTLPLQPLLEKSRQRALALDPSLNISLAADAALTVNADEALLSRAVDNLLDNARKYAGQSPVEVSAARQDGAAVIAVRDHGRGFPEAELEHVFDPFFRGETARGQASGFGLGLALAKRVAEAHGGSAKASNAEGGGARVELRLPGAP